MFSPEDQEAIVRFVFSKDENVELALAVMAAGRRIAEKIIKEFLTKLEEKLRQGAKELGESWKVVNDLISDPFTRDYLVMGVAKEDWRGLYRIGLWPEKRDARDFVVGVQGDWDRLPKLFDGGRVKKALEGLLPAGITDDWNPFYMRAQQAYRDWGEPETLSCLHSDRGDLAVTYFADTIRTMARATEGIIDSVVQGWSKRQQKE
jgi:hypothetical protein